MCAFSVGPSQIRYVCYYDYCLDHVMTKRPSIHLSAVEIPASENEGKDGNTLLRYMLTVVRVGEGEESEE